MCFCVLPFIGWMDQTLVLFLWQHSKVALLRGKGWRGHLGIRVDFSFRKLESSIMDHLHETMKSFDLITGKSVLRHFINKTATYRSTSNIAV